MEGKGKGKAKAKGRGIGPKSADSGGHDGRPDAPAENTAQASGNPDIAPLGGNQGAEIMTRDRIADNKSIRETSVKVWVKRVDNGQWIQIIIRILDGVKVP